MSRAAAVAADADGDAFDVLVMRNGGNNTAEARVLRAQVTHATTFDRALIARWADELGLLEAPGDERLRGGSGGRVSDLAVGNRFGRPLRSAATLKRNDVLFLIASTERWMWPGLYVGACGALSERARSRARSEISFFAPRAPLAQGTRWRSTKRSTAASWSWKRSRCRRDCFAFEDF